MARYKLSKVKTRKYPPGTPQDNRRRTILTIAVLREDDNGNTRVIPHLHAHRWNRRNWRVIDSKPVQNDALDSNGNREIICYTEQETRYYLRIRMRQHGYITGEEFRSGRDQG